MRDPQFVIGAAPYGVSRFLSVYGVSWAALLFQQNRALTDAELNQAQRVIGEQRRLAWSEIAAAGWLSTPTPATGGTANLAVVHSGSLLVAAVDGAILDVRGADGSTTVSIGLDTPPATGTRTDLVYLEVWHEEVQPATSPEGASAAIYRDGDERNLATLTNDLIVLAPAETTRRIQRRYRIRYASGQNDLALVSLGAGQYDAWSAGEQTGLYVRGDGSRQAAQALLAVDGYRYAIPLATVSRPAGQTTIPSSAISFAGRVVNLAANAADVDGISAYSTPLAGFLLPLGESGAFPASVFTLAGGAAANADLVDGYHANATPTANTILPLDGSAKLPNAALRTGAGQGINADMLDGAHAASSPAANTILILDSSARLPNSVLRTGTGQGLGADSVDSYHANATPTAGAILVLDGSGKYPIAALRTGTGQGIDADTVDTRHASASPAASTLLVLDGSAKYPNSALRTGSGQGIDADTVDGSHAAAFALATHQHSGRIGMRLAQASGDYIISGGVTSFTLSNGLTIPAAPSGGRYFAIFAIVLTFPQTPTNNIYVAIQPPSGGSNLQHTVRQRSGTQSLIHHLVDSYNAASEQPFYVYLYNITPDMTVGFSVCAAAVWMKD